MHSTARLQNSKETDENDLASNGKKKHLLRSQLSCKQQDHGIHVI